MTWLHGRTFKILLGVAILLIVAGVMWRRPWTPKTPRIVVILPSPSNPFWIEVRAGAEQAAAKLGNQYAIVVQSSLDMDAASQTELLNGFLSRRAVDALVLGPASDTETVSTVARYSEREIPIVVIDTELNAQQVATAKINISAFIGSDNVDGGRKAAQAMSDALQGGSRRVLLIEGSRVHQSAIDRASGFNEVAATNHLEVIPVNGEWKRDKAAELVGSQFSRGHVDGIFASNDDMALGAVAALRARGTKPAEWPVIVGFDATRDGLKAVADGDMRCTIQQDARGLGEQGVMSAVRALKHDPALLPRNLLAVNVRCR